MPLAYSGIIALLAAKPCAFATGVAQACPDCLTNVDVWARIRRANRSRRSTSAPSHEQGRHVLGWRVPLVRAPVVALAALVPGLPRGLPRGPCRRATMGCARRRGGREPATSRSCSSAEGRHARALALVGPRVPWSRWGAADFRRWHFDCRPGAVTLPQTSRRGSEPRRHAEERAELHDVRGLVPAGVARVVVFVCRGASWGERRGPSCVDPFSRPRAESLGASRSCCRAPAAARWAPTGR